MKTAVVILNWNGKTFLEQFLPSVTQSVSGLDAEVIVADNASTDGSVEFLKEMYPDVRVILLDKNYGFTGGYNRALAQVNATYYVLLNSDIEVAPDWLSPLVELMDTQADVAACMPKIRSYHNREYFEYAGASGGFIDRYAFPFCRGRILGNIEKDEGQYNTPVEVFWATGACMMVRSSVYNKLAGLDEGFFAHMEEIDLCWRMHNRGYKVMVQPQSAVYHVGGGTLANNSPRKLFLNYRNSLLMLYKNLPKGRLFPVFFMRYCLDCISGMIYLFTFRFSSLKALIKGYWHFLRLRKAYKTKRNAELSLKVDKNKAGELFFPRSIVLQFYMSKSKRRFSDLHFNIK